MDANHKEIHSLLQSRQAIMVSQLHQWCAINSSSYNLEGLENFSELLITAFKPIADIIEKTKSPPFQTLDMSGRLNEQAVGKSLLIRKRPKLKQRVLLAGHMDTVYPADSGFQTLNYLSENRLNGPGVADMKGGLIVILHALSAFEQTAKASNIGWDVLINADEEIGSPSSSTLFNSIAPSYFTALLYEPAMDTKGTFAKNRKGSGVLTVIATGLAAHAGRSFHEGRNAICYLSEIVLALHDLNGKRKGVTLNVGKIAGGDAVNIVADKAVAKLDIRISHPDDETWVRTKIDSVFQRLKKTGYKIELSGNFGRPVKRISEATEELFQRICQVGKKLGLTIDWKDSGGCCDGNNLAQFGIPVIDTLGVRGGNIHSDQEFILIDSLVERAALSAFLLMDLATDLGALQT